MVNNKFSNRISFRFVFLPDWFLFFLDMKMIEQKIVYFSIIISVPILSNFSIAKNFRIFLCSIVNPIQQNVIKQWHQN